MALAGAISNAELGKTPARVLGSGKVHARQGTLLDGGTQSSPSASSPSRRGSNLLFNSSIWWALSFCPTAEIK